MPRARRPALPSAETSFRGKGAAACRCRPRPFQVGVFLCVLLPVPFEIALLPSLWGKRRRGGSKPWFLPQRCLPLSSISSHERREPRVLGLLDSVQAYQYTWEQSHGSPPVLGVWSKRPERRRARAALCAPHGLAVWQRIHTPVRISGGFSRQEGGEEHDLRDCGTLC